MPGLWSKENKPSPAVIPTERSKISPAILTKQIWRERHGDEQGDTAEAARNDVQDSFPVQNPALASLRLCASAWPRDFSPPLAQRSQQRREATPLIAVAGGTIRAASGARPNRVMCLVPTLSPAQLWEAALASRVQPTTDTPSLCLHLHPQSIRHGSLQTLGQLPGQSWDDKATLNAEH